MNQALRSAYLRRLSGLLDREAAYRIVEADFDPTGFDDLAEMWAAIGTQTDEHLAALRDLFVDQQSGEAEISRASTRAVVDLRAAAKALSISEFSEAEFRALGRDMAYRVVARLGNELRMAQALTISGSELRDKTSVAGALSKALGRNEPISFSTRHILNDIEESDFNEIDLLLRAAGEEVDSIDGNPLRSLLPGGYAAAAVKAGFDEAATEIRLAARSFFSSERSLQDALESGVWRAGELRSFIDQLATSATDLQSRTPSGPRQEPSSAQMSLSLSRTLGHIRQVAENLPMVTMLIEADRSIAAISQFGETDATRPSTKLTLSAVENLASSGRLGLHTQSVKARSSEPSDATAFARLLVRYSANPDTRAEADNGETHWESVAHIFYPDIYENWVRDRDVVKTETALESLEDRPPGLLEEFRAFRYLAQDADPSSRSTRELGRDWRQMLKDAGGRKSWRRLTADRPESPIPEEADFPGEWSDKHARDLVEEYLSRLEAVLTPRISPVEGSGTVEPHLVKSSLDLDFPLVTTDLHEEAARLRLLYAGADLADVHSVYSTATQALDAVNDAMWSLNIGSLSTEELTRVGRDIAIRALTKCLPHGWRALTEDEHSFYDKRHAAERYARGVVARIPETVDVDFAEAVKTIEHKLLSAQEGPIGRLLPGETIRGQVAQAFLAAVAEVQPAVGALSAVRAEMEESLQAHSSDEGAKPSKEFLTQEQTCRLALNQIADFEASTPHWSRSHSPVEKQVEDVSTVAKNAPAVMLWRDAIKSVALQRIAAGKDHRDYFGLNDVSWLARMEGPLTFGALNSANYTASLITTVESVADERYERAPYSIDDHSLDPWERALYGLGVNGSKEAEQLMQDWMQTGNPFAIADGLRELDPQIADAFEFDWAKSEFADSRIVDDFAHLKALGHVRDQLSTSKAILGR